MCPNDADCMANSADPDQTALGLHCLPRPVCLKSLIHYGKHHNNELPHDKTNKMICVSSEDSDQPGHLPSLIRVFTVRSMGN